MRAKNLTHCSKAAILFCLLFVSRSVFAEVLWIPTAGINLKSLEFKRPFDPSTTKATFTMLDLTVTAAFDTFYIQLNTNQPVSEEKTSDSIGEVVVERDDVTLTMGCNCLSTLEKLTVFVGYNTGTTLIRGTEPGSTFEESYKDSGFFVGGSYPLLKNNYGSLTGVAAYASLAGSLHFQDEISATDIIVDGDTAGLSYGLTWNAGLSENMNYTISIKQQTYVFDTEKFSMDKTFTSIAGTVTLFF